MSADSINVTSRATLQDIADRVALSGAPQAALYAAAAAGRIALIVIEGTDAAWPAETVARVRRPTVVLLGGDPGWGQPSFGPGRWRCAKKLREWAAGAIVHGAAGKPEHYLEAVVLGIMFERLAFIETTSGLARTWSAFLDQVPRMGYLPAEGAHPVAPVVCH